jgi:hypothetical protein
MGDKPQPLPYTGAKSAHEHFQAKWYPVCHGEML